MNDPLLGTQLPELQLSNSQGGTLSLPQDLKGTWTILYFYPKDDTPGCTKQACSYRDSIEDFSKADIAIYGVSMDDLDSHAAFRDKFQLNFPLIADTEGKLSTALGVYGDQEWAGKIFKGLSRDSFVIDPEGIIRKIWRKVNPTTTMASTYEAVQELKQASAAS